MYAALKTQLTQRLIGPLIGRLPVSVKGYVFQNAFSTEAQAYAKQHFALDREAIAQLFIAGDGIEIGALHNPLKVPHVARVKHVDRMSIADLRRSYPELANESLIEPEIIDDGETLATIIDSSQDFVIANHFIEHCQNPIKAIENILRVLKTTGVCYLAIPDKRQSFDIDRSITPIEHLFRDYEEGPTWSRPAHFEDFARFACKIPESEIASFADDLMAKDYSIHYHVWTQAEMLEMMAALRRKLKFPFEVELLLQLPGETIFILRKVAS